MAEPLVSIIIPVYNAERFLHECVESVISQSYKRLEILLINDGSQDNSGSICKEYAERDNRIRFFTHENKGVSFSRNRGIDNSMGDLLVFLDSDDILNKDFVENAIDKMTSMGADLYIGGFVLFDSCKKTDFKQEKITCYSAKTLFENMGTKYHSEWIGLVGSKVYWKKIIYSNRLMFDESIDFGEDACFNFQYISKARKIVFDNTCLYYYRESHGDSLGSKYRRNAVELHQKVFTVKDPIMREAGCSCEFIDNYCAMTLIGDIIKLYTVDKEVQAIKKREILKQVSLDLHVKRCNVFQVEKRKWCVILVLLKLKQYRLLDCMLVLYRSVL